MLSGTSNTNGVPISLLQQEGLALELAEALAFPRGCTLGCLASGTPHVSTEGLPLFTLRNRDLPKHLQCICYVFHALRISLKQTGPLACTASKLEMYILLVHWG